MSQYLLSVHSDPDAAPPTPEAMAQAYQDVDAFNARLRAAGAWVFAGGLLPPSDATVVRVAEGRVTTTDGPVIVSGAQLGGFWIIEATDRDAAVAWAAEATAACRAPVEVRPFQDEP